VEIVDGIALLLVHPTGERDENKPQRVWQRGHGVKATRGWFIDCLRLPDLKSTRLSNRHSVMASIGFLDNTSAQSTAQVYPLGLRAARDLTSRRANDACGMHRLC